MIRLRFCHETLDEQDDPFSEDFTWLGIQEDEYFPVSPFARDSFLTAENRFYQCHVESEFYSTDEIAPNLYLCTCRACLTGSDVSGPPVNLYLRASFVFRWDADGPRCCHVHYSTPYVDVAAQETIPEEELFRRQELYRLAAECSTDIIYEYLPDTDSAVFYQIDQKNGNGELMIKSRISDCRRQFGQGYVFHPGEAQLAVDRICSCSCEPFEARLYEAWRDEEDPYQWCHISGKRIVKDGKVQRVVGIIRNIHAEKMAQNALMQEAATDYLTGLYTRRYAIRSIEDHLMKECSYGLLLMDLDNFKSINDTYGHATGDMVLVETSRLLQSTFRATDICTRMGGDEFMVFMPNNTSFKTMEDRCAHIEQELHTVLDKMEITVSAGISIGGIYGAAYADFEALYRKVDELLYQVKNRQKGGWLIKPFEP